MELQRREPIFHRASGGVLERRYAEGVPDAWAADEFGCRELGPDTYLLTYRLRQGDRVTRRATVWRSSGGGWQALYHQGTVVTT
ncbi:hypothetical protein [Streptomyces sp. SID13031]|uniref:hypothetical protein n=1 Tax=Streptomyces sp. SID13031 TaxID=2706046 RepID=UPI0013CB9C0C|nr:hypothetical protein [Streptomyces sp. SID13031]NEA33331.1 hypothetical protein [Streptomyces sp. SID13031]